MMVRYALTTVDNPYDPFDEFREWFEYDRAAGYDTLDYLGRISTYSSDLSVADQQAVVSDAIDSILEEHGYSFYKKVSQEFTDQYEVAS